VSIRRTGCPTFIAAREKAKYLIFNVTGTNNTYWVSADSSGIKVGDKFKAADAHVQATLKLFEESELLPYPERLYGIYDGNRIITLVYVHAKDYEIRFNRYVLKGEQVPAVCRQASRPQGLVGGARCAGQD
jgi:hypothetical protein